MYDANRGVDNDLRCTLPINASSMTEEICNQITEDWIQQIKHVEH